MTAKQYLRRTIYLRIQIRNLDERIQELRHRMTSVGAIRYDKISVQSSPDDPMSTNIAKLIDSEQKLLQLEADLSELQVEILEKLKRMDSDLYRTILTMRYLHGKQLRKIAEEINYSEGYVLKLHRQALQAFEQVM